MSFYSNLAATAVRLLTKYGQSLTFTRYTKGSFDAGTGSRTETTSTFTAKSVKYPYTTLEKANSAIQEGDIRLISEVATFRIGDTVAIDSLNWRVMSVEPIDPGGTPVAYLLQVRR